MSNRPYQTSDCTVRAFAILTKLPYDDIYDELARAGRKSSHGFDSTGWLKRRGGLAFGARFKRVDVKGLTVDTFAARYPKGRFMLEVEGHVWALINGIHHDMWRISKPLTGAWECHLNHYKQRINR